MERTGEVRGFLASVGDVRYVNKRPRPRRPRIMVILMVFLLLTASAVLLTYGDMMAQNGSRRIISSSVFDSRFIPPHSDFALDENENGLNDRLVIRAGVDIAAAGGYDFGIQLFAGTNTSGSYLGGANISYELDVGMQQVDLWIGGGLIRASGHDGNFTARLYVLNGSVEIDQDLHTTSFYLAADFDYGPAFFEGQIIDCGLDLNNNTKYDYLVVNVTVNVTVLGDYFVDAILVAPGNLGVGGVSCDVRNTTGLQEIQLNFSGNGIYHSGLDGPYRADLRLFSLPMPPGPLDTTSYLTATYGCVEFEPDFGLCVPVNDYGLDTDGDGLYNYLVLEVPVNLPATADYDLYGTLRPNPPYDIIANGENHTYKDAGLGTMELQFDGKLISSYGSDGPYLVQLVLWGNTSFYTSDHTTSSYLASEFERSAYLKSTLTSRPIDTDSDGLFNELVVEATVVVEDEGDFLLFGTLYNDSMMFVQIDQAGNFTHLPIGSQTFEISFNGWKISEFGTDGVYYFAVNLCLANGVAVDSGVGNTSAMLASEFNPPPEPIVVPWLVTFENASFGTGDMAGWSASIPQAVSVSTQTSETGTMSLAICGTEPYVEVLSPLVNLGAYSQIEVRYWIRVGSTQFSDPPDWADELFVYFWNTTDWELLEHYTSAPPPGSTHVTVRNSTWSTGNYIVQLRFVTVHGDGPGTDYWHIDNVYIGPPREPIASLSVSVGLGDLSTVFEFDASSSWDIETPSSQLEFRWDWEGDGDWDTNWTNNPCATHQFSSVGTYEVKVEVRDSQGNVNTTSLEVTVLDSIPEFQNALIPVISFVLLFAAVARRSRRRSE